MKKLTSIILLTALLLSAATALAATRIAIVQPMSHTSLNQIRDTIVSELEASISNLSELQPAAESLIAKGVDTLYTGNDNSIASAMATYTDIAYSAGIPVYCGADSMVADGGFATIGVNYVQLGEQVAAMALRILDGAQPAELPYEALADYARFVNLQAVERFGGELPEGSLDGYEVLVEADGTSHFGQ